MLKIIANVILILPDFYPPFFRVCKIVKDSRNLFILLINAEINCKRYNNTSSFFLFTITSSFAFHRMDKIMKKLVLKLR